VVLLQLEEPALTCSASAIYEILALYSLYYNETRTHLARRPTIWGHHTSLGRIASSLRADMIFGMNRCVYRNDGEALNRARERGIFAQRAMNSRLVTHTQLGIPPIQLRRKVLYARAACPDAAAQTRIVSGGAFWPSRGDLSRHLKYMAPARIEFVSHHPSQAVRAPRRQEAHYDRRITRYCSRSSRRPSAGCSRAAEGRALVHRAQCHWDDHFRDITQRGAVLVKQSQASERPTIRGKRAR
jgi:hypothetical protein